jgi:hypothetical protein
MTFGTKTKWPYKTSDLSKEVQFIWNVLWSIFMNECIIGQLTWTLVKIPFHVMYQVDGLLYRYFKPIIRSMKSCNTCTVKPAHAVTSIKQPPALKGHLYCLSCHRTFHMNWTSFERSLVTCIITHPLGTSHERES